MKYIFAMSSVTYAMKAKRLLNGLGMYCEIEKTPKNLSKGCGYSIRTKDGPETVLRILEENGIYAKGYIEREG